MDTQQLITRTERVDDLPLLRAQMRKIGLAKLINKHFPAQGNWQGLSIVQVTTGWLSYILSAIQTRRKRAYKDHPARTEEQSNTTIHSAIDPLAYQNAVRCLVYVSNDFKLSRSEAVLAYREEYLIGRGFGRYKSKVLGLTPLYLSSEDRIKGLVRLLSIGLRILCLLEFSVCQALDENNEQLVGIYRGNPKRATHHPTAEMMLKAFEWINLTEVSINGTKYRCLSPLFVVQERILAFSGFPAMCP